MHLMDQDNRIQILLKMCILYCLDSLNSVLFFKEESSIPDDVMFSLVMHFQNLSGVNSSISKTACVVT